MAGRVNGKVALVTGAARGGGRSHAVRLAEEGADIIAFDLCGPVDDVAQQYPPSTEEDLARTVSAVEEAGGRIVASKGDVRDLSALRAAVDSGVEAFGHLDIVVANAGSLKLGAETHLAAQSEWDEMIGVNLTGVWNTARAAVPTMIDQGTGGSIVIISSVAGFKGTPLLGAYSAAKHGVVGLMRTFALELGNHRIRANTVHPTGIATPMVLHEAMYRLFRPDLDAPTRDDYERRTAAHNVLPVSLIDPVDVSNAVLFLASDEARYVTGVALPVDAGATAK